MLAAGHDAERQATGFAQHLASGHVHRPSAADYLDGQMAVLISASPILCTIDGCELVAG